MQESVAECPLVHCLSFVPAFLDYFPCCRNKIHLETLLDMYTLMPKLFLFYFVSMFITCRPTLKSSLWPIDDYYYILLTLDLNKLPRGLIGYLTENVLPSFGDIIC